MTDRVAKYVELACQYKECHSGLSVQDNLEYLDKLEDAWWEMSVAEMVEARRILDNG